MQRTGADDPATSIAQAIGRGPAAPRRALATELHLNRGALLTAAAGLAFSVSSLPFYAIGSLTKPLQAEFGWSRGQIQGFFTLLTLGVVVASPFIGRLLRRYGTRRLASAFGLGVGMILLGATTTSLRDFYGGALFTALVGAGTTSVLWSQVVFDIFRVRPAFTLALVLTLNGLLVMLLPMLATELMQWHGWRAAFVGFGVLPLLVVLPLSWMFLRGGAPVAVAREDHAEAAGLTLRQAIATRQFWGLVASFFIVMVGTMGLSTNLVPLLTDKGFSPAAAGRMMGVMALGIVIGRLSTGYLLDRMWAPLVGAVVFWVPALTCMILLSPTHDPAATTAAVLALGAAIGAELDPMPYFVRRYFGMRHYGDIYGVCFAVFVSASGVAPPLFGHAFDATGSYALTLRMTAICFVAGAATLLTLGRYPEFAADSPVRPDE